MKHVKAEIEVIVYEPELKQNTFYNSHETDFELFKANSNYHCCR